MAAVQGLREVREAILIAYAFDAIDDEEYFLLTELNISREIYPYWNFPTFDLNLWDDQRCLTELRFRKTDLNELKNALQLPDKIVTCQRTVCSGIEGLCIFLKRLAFPCRYTDMVASFGLNPTELCLIFNSVLDFVYEHHNHRLHLWNQDFLQPAKLQQYADTIHQKGAPLQNCFGFVDGTVVRIARPQQNQRVCYNGHKRVHALKFQSIALPNGIIANFKGPFEGRRHDSTMLQQSGTLVELQGHAWYNGQALCIYGDPAYPLSVHIQTPHRAANLTPAQHNYNKAMSEVRVSVEWLFGDVKNFFKFVDYKKDMTIGRSAVGKTVLVCGILHNARACLYGNMTSSYFDEEPPTLQEYFQ